jgi:hypothetical protein
MPTPGFAALLMAKARARTKEAKAMYQLNSIELWRERSHELLREAESRQLRAGFRREIASWGRTSIPFFQA